MAVVPVPKASRSQEAASAATLALLGSKAEALLKRAASYNRKPAQRIPRAPQTPQLQRTRTRRNPVSVRRPHEKACPSNNSDIFFFLFSSPGFSLCRAGLFLFLLFLPPPPFFAPIPPSLPLPMQCFVVLKRAWRCGICSLVVSFIREPCFSSLIEQVVWGRRTGIRGEWPLNRAPDAKFRLAR